MRFDRVPDDARPRVRPRTAETCDGLFTSDEGAQTACPVTLDYSSQTSSMNTRVVLGVAAPSVWRARWALTFTASLLSDSP